MIINIFCRIIGGDVTSTVLYCWMAAIVEQLPGDKKKFLCTGTLVKQDLIVTSASCTHRSGFSLNSFELGRRFLHNPVVNLRNIYARKFQL